jgi:inosine-uridine nucleoside N-ribohydrolase
VKDEKPYHPYLNIVNLPALDMTLESISCYPRRSITYIVLGPMTNLALILHHKRGKAFRDNIGCVVAMGGALNIPGNTSPVAECKEKIVFYLEY